MCGISPGPRMQGMIPAFRFSYLGLVAGTLWRNVARLMLRAIVQLRRRGRKSVKQCAPQYIKGVIPQSFSWFFPPRGFANSLQNWRELRACHDRGWASANGIQPNALFPRSPSDESPNHLFQPSRLDHGTVIWGLFPDADFAARSLCPVGVMLRCIRIRTEARQPVPSSCDATHGSYRRRIPFQIAVAAGDAGSRCNSSALIALQEALAGRRQRSARAYIADWG
jgi:hypothetical protein